MAPDEKLTAADTVIIVAYHLPIRVKRKEGGGYAVEWDDDRGLHKDGMNLACRCIYVGCIDMEITDTREQDAVERLLLEQYSCVVLFLNQVVKDAYYHGFCRGYLAPIMNNQMHVARGSDPFQQDQWTAYCKVNQLFAAKVVGVHSEGSMIWVHDYHLLLLPSFILRKLRTAKIGFFLHAPFPASDLWRSIPVREELLHGLLNADLIGFLLFEYTRNFLSCCKRMMGLEFQFEKSGSLGVEYEGRHVGLQVATFGISPSTISARLGAVGAEVASELGELAPVLSRSGTTIIAGVDYLDRLKGIANKLLAWEALLADYPRYQKGHVLVQVCIRARNRVNIRTSGEVEEELNGIVQRINGRYPGAVVFEVRSDMSAAARLQLWCASGIHLCTALREAINVWPLEYVMARHLRGLQPGVVVLSEFTGFARILTGALRANPFSQLEMVETLDRALRMQHPERAALGRKAVEHIQRCTLEEFARRFVVDLKSVSTKNAEDFISVGFGLASFRMVGMGSGFRKVDKDETFEKFHRASHRALLLDWGGTLTPVGGFYDHRETVGSAVPERVLNVLTKLCAEPNTHVMILSGLDKVKVLGSFGSVPDLSLAVEHGFNFRIKDGPWQELMPGADTSWKAVAESVMSGYAARTHGAYIQSKGSSIVWNFQEADPEFGVMQAKEVQITLQSVLAAFPVVVLRGKGYVEACLRDLNKGATATRVLDLAAEAGKPFDFVLCAGDDSNDELMFASLNAKLGKEAPELVTVTVGRKPSEASTYLDDHNEVVELLELLCEPKSDFSGGMGTQVCGLAKKKGLCKSMSFMGGSSSHFDLASLA